jgi:sugar transferase (PEP-CTERM system associated)
MLRVFGLFLPVPPLILAIVESATLTIALCAVIIMDNRQAGGHEAELVQFAVALSVSVIVVMLAVGLYNADTFLDRRLSVIRILIALVLGAPVALTISLLFAVLSRTTQDLEPYWPVKAGIAWLICLCITRTMFAHFSDLEVLKRKILVLGSGMRALKLDKLAKSSSPSRFIPVGFVSACGDPHLVRCVGHDAGSNGRILADAVEKLGAQEIVIATDDRRGLPVEQLLRCRLSGVRVIDYISFCEREAGRVDLDALQPSWFIFSEGFRFGWWSELVKRSVDVAISLTLLIIVLPIVALTALAIKLESGGPILYRQERVGLRGRRFVLLKFRSMRRDAEENGGPMWAQQRDPRTTRVGSFIRKVRIDELPQLLNVIRGDMSFVGPRPERPYFVDQLTAEIPYYSERHAVRPGITGWAQINYPYGASVEDAREKLSYDLYYLKNRGLFLDLVILMQTARVILWPQGAR